MAKPVIEFRDFSFRYKAMKEDTLKHIDLTIYEGEKVLILGPSGSGKSTLGNCINGLIPFSCEGTITGSLKVGGVETRDTDLFHLSSMVGTVQQDTDAQFIGLSVGEDIAFALENDAVPRPIMLKKVQQAAEVVGMQDFLEEVPYDLSGGQKQKVALAGVLHNDTGILLFDEPLAALDPAMGMKAVDLIDRIHKEQHKTILMIEHRLEDMLYRPVDRIVLIAEGRVALDTTPDGLLHSNALQQMGIREPLYLTALKNAGVDLDHVRDLADLSHMDLSGVQEQIIAHYQKDLSSMEEHEHEKKVVLNVENVCFAYDEKPVLKDVSFTVEQGERISIIGRNGAGKSTMAKLLCGIERPDQGSITCNGENILNMSIQQIGRLVGYVMQNPNQMLVKDMIKEEVQLAMELNHMDAATIEENTQIVLRMCDLYGMRNWPVSVLSYGQRKRVTIASIMSLRPQVLIVDEPTAGQDLRHYTEIMNFLEQLNQESNITILFITHDMHLAIEYTDRAMVFTDGQLIADDRVCRVLSNDEVIDKASLKRTSLSALAHKIGLDPENLIHAFIEEERRNRNAQSSVH